MNLTIDGIEHTIPESWQELPYQDYASMAEPKDAEAYAALKGFGLHAYVVFLLSFLNTEIPAVPCGSEVDILLKPWSDWEQARQASEEHENELLAFAALISHYEGTDISQLPVPVAFGYLEHYQKQLDQIKEDYGHIDFDKLIDDEKQRMAMIDDDGSELFADVSLDLELIAMGYKPHEYDMAMDEISLFALWRNRLTRYKEALYQYNYRRYNNQG